MKLVTDDKALNLAVQLLQNDKDIQEELSDNVNSTKEELLNNDNAVKSELSETIDILRNELTNDNKSIKEKLNEKASTEELENSIIESKKYTDSVLTITEF